MTEVINAFTYQGTREDVKLKLQEEKYNFSLKALIVTITKSVWSNGKNKELAKEDLG